MSLTVEDRTLEFLLRRDTNIAPPDLQSLHDTPFAVHHWRDAFDGVQQDLRHSVWRCKSELDAIDGATYTATRNKLFPLAVGGTSTHRFTNRAGYKLMESMDSTGVWQHLTTTRKSRKRPHSVAFADVCGGPGSFSQALFSVARKYNTKLEGFGMTLAGVDGLDWYPELAKRSTFTATYGLDGKGDIFKLSNIEALASLTTRAGVALVVADGGFHVDFSVANYQETISARIMYGQWLAALKIHVTGGCFVLKLFDTFSPLTRAVLFLSTFLYDRVHIVKPKHSRIVNSERYLVCIGYRGMPAGWMQHLDRCYVEGFTKEDHVPDLISSAWMAQDTVFMHDLEEMNRVIAENQQSALRMIVEAAPAVKEEYEKRAAQEAAAPQPASTAIGGVSE